MYTRKPPEGKGKITGSVFSQNLALQSNDVCGSPKLYTYTVIPCFYAFSFTSLCVYPKKKKSLSITLKKYAVLEIGDFFLKKKNTLHVFSVFKQISLQTKGQQNADQEIKYINMKKTLNPEKKIKISLRKSVNFFSRFFSFLGVFKPKSYYNRIGASILF